MRERRRLQRVRRRLINPWTTHDRHASTGKALEQLRNEVESLPLGRPPDAQPTRAAAETLKRVPADRGPRVDSRQRAGYRPGVVANLPIVTSVPAVRDRKSTRLNSIHVKISY